MGGTYVQYAKQDSFSGCCREWQAFFPEEAVPADERSHVI
jgi:hypothetical protein